MPNNDKPYVDPTNPPVNPPPPGTILKDTPAGQVSEAAFAPTFTTTPLPVVPTPAEQLTYVDPTFEDRNKPFIDPIFDERNKPYVDPTFEDRNQPFIDPTFDERNKPYVDPTNPPINSPPPGTELVDTSAGQISRVASAPSPFGFIGQPTQSDIDRQDAIMVPTQKSEGQGLADPAIAKIAKQDQITKSQNTSSMILSARGTFYEVSISDDSSPGMYAIQELTKFITQQQFGNANAIGPLDPTQPSAVPPILLTSIEFTQSDITSEMPCLNNVKVFYTFGQNFGQVQISGEVLLGPLGNDQQHNRGFRLIRDFYAENRVSKLKRPVAVSIANEVFFVYLKGLRVGTIDRNFHIMPFMMFGTLLDINRDDALTVNLSSVVVTSGNVDTATLISALQASKPDDLVISETTTATSTPINDTPTNNLNISKPGDGSSTISGNKGTAAAIVAEAVLQGKIEPDQAAWRLLTQQLVSMRGEHIEEVAKHGPLSADAEGNFQNAIFTLTQARDNVGDRIVDSANNQTKVPFDPTTIRTLNTFGDNPANVFAPNQFSLEAFNARWDNSYEQQLARGVPNPVVTSPTAPGFNASNALYVTGHSPLPDP